MVANNCDNSHCDRFEFAIAMNFMNCKQIERREREGEGQRGMREKSFMKIHRPWSGSSGNCVIQMATDDYDDDDDYNNNNSKSVN